MAKLDENVDPLTLDVWATPESERFLTPATIITFVRTIATVVIIGFALNQGLPDNDEFWSPALKLMTVALGVYWFGDMTLLLALLHGGGSVAEDSGTFLTPYYVGGGILILLFVLVAALLAFGRGREHS